MESYPCSKEFLLGSGLGPGIDLTSYTFWNQILQWISQLEAEHGPIFCLILSLETMLNKQHGRAKGWSQAE